MLKSSLQATSRRNKRIMYKRLIWRRKRHLLGIQPESVVAFCASKELCCSLITCTSLHLPRVSQVVLAFWTANSCCRISLQLLVFFSDNHNFFAGLLLDNLFYCRFFGGFLAITDGTMKNGAVFGSFQDHPFSTRGTKLHYTLFLKQNNPCGHYSILTYLHLSGDATFPEHASVCALFPAG